MGIGRQRNLTVAGRKRVKRAWDSLFLGLWPYISTTYLTPGSRHPLLAEEVNSHTSFPHQLLGSVKPLEDDGTELSELLDCFKLGLRDFNRVAVSSSFDEKDS